MPLLIDEEELAAKSRLAFVMLSSLTLRLMENWRRGMIAMTGHPPDCEAAMVIAAVLTIAGQNLTRPAPEAQLLRLEVPIPDEALNRCNVSSISAATGLHKETARRRINQLIRDDILVKDSRGGVRFSESFRDSPAGKQIMRDQLDAVRRIAEQLSRIGILRSSRSYTGMM